MKSSLLAILVIINFLFSADLLAASPADSVKSIADKARERAKRDKKVTNQTILDFTYGVSLLSISSGGDKLANAYPIEGTYGFIRIDDKQDGLNYLRYDSEFASFGNISAHMGPAYKTSDGNPTDGWRGALGLSNGYGYQYDKGKHILLLCHESAFSINRIDIEYPATNEQDQQIFNQFDEEYRMGSFFRSQLKYKVSGIFWISGGYEHSLVYPSFEFLPWLGGWLIENVSQRWIDFVEPELMEFAGDDYPWLYFGVKSMLSFAMYELRRSKAFWPFASSEPLNYDSFKIGITLVI
jgi:hypothetical protein